MKLGMGFYKRRFAGLLRVVLSQITTLFPRKIDGVTAEGLPLRLFLFLWMFTLNGGVCQNDYLAT